MSFSFSPPPSIPPSTFGSYTNSSSSSRNNGDPSQQQQQQGWTHTTTTTSSTRTGNGYNSMSRSSGDGFTSQGVGGGTSGDRGGGALENPLLSRRTGAPSTMMMMGRSCLAGGSNSNYHNDNYGSTTYRSGGLGGSNLMGADSMGGFGASGISLSYSREDPNDVMGLRQRRTRRATLGDEASSENIRPLQHPLRQQQQQASSSLRANNKPRSMFPTMMSRAVHHSTTISQPMSNWKQNVDEEPLPAPNVQSPVFRESGNILPFETVVRESPDGMDQFSPSTANHGNRNHPAPVAPLLAWVPKETPVEPIPATTGCWVLVVGYATEDQYKKILRVFRSYGRVLQHRGTCAPGRSNFLVLQYENKLQAAKALAHSFDRIIDGIFVAVKKLEDDDPLLKEQLPWSSSDPEGDAQTNNDNHDSNVQDFWNTRPTAGTGSVNSATDTAGVLTEEDILLHGNSTLQRHHDPSDNEISCCGYLIRWFLGIPLDNNTAPQ